MTPTLRSENDDRPRLEFYPINSAVLRTVVVELFPFVIGRGDHTQLKINSTSVSREHAKLTKTPEGLRLQDMESTNGTEVNGESIGDVLLEDGDTIRIAETEFTFRCPSAESDGMERMVTQPLAGKKKSQVKSERLSLLTAQRTLNEALLWQTIPLCRTSVFQCRSNSLRATLVSAGEPIATQLRECTSCEPQSTAFRVQQLTWMIAARRASHLPSEGTLFLRFDLHSGLDHRLHHAFEIASECLSDDRPLGLLMPWEWAVQSPATIKLCADLKSRGANLAFDTFTGGATCIDSMENASPNLLVLAPAIARNISSNPRRKKHLEKIVSRCKDFDIRLVLPSGLEKTDQDEVFDLGVELVIRNEERHGATHFEKPVVAIV